ncbi:MAG: response regulator [Myxococcota bacterium]
MAGARNQRPRVLVVEDDAALLRLVSRLISEFADVEMASNGKEALEVVQATLAPGTPSFDLIVTDVMMPLMDGLTLARELKADARLGRIPIIMLTAKNSSLDVIKGINAGARTYLTKPFKQDELITKARKLLRLP